MANSKSIDRAIDQAMAATGVRVKCGIPLMLSGRKKAFRRWTDEEDQIIKTNVGKLSIQEIATKLRRSSCSIKIRGSRELKLIMGLSKSDHILTAEHVAAGLGLDLKSVHKLMNRGLMPVRRLAFVRVIRVIDRLAFLRWMLNPMHWLYFKPERVGMMTRRGKRPFSDGYDYSFWEQAALQMKGATKKWRDRWLLPSEAGTLMGIHRHNINAAINAGNLKATRWGNWRVLKSDMPKKGKFNAKGRLVDKLYPVGKFPGRHGRIRKVRA